MNFCFSSLYFQPGVFTLPFAELIRALLHNIFGANKGLLCSELGPKEIGETFEQLMKEFPLRAKLNVIVYTLLNTTKG